jgi:hypothetical protein
MPVFSNTALTAAAARSSGRRSQKSSLWGSFLENLVKAVLANATR